MVSTRQRQNAAARRWACAGGVGVQRGDGPGRPPVHEMQRVLVPAWYRGEQPGGPGRGYRGGQASRRLDRRPQLLGQVGLVAGVLLRGQPGVLQRDLAAFGAFDGFLDGLLDPVDAGPALGVGGPLGGLADLEDQGGVIDRDPVDRRPGHQLGGHRGGRQMLQQPGQHDVVDRQGHGLGQAGVQVPARPGQPGGRVGDAAVPQPVLHPLGDVLEAGLPAAQQRVEVFQGARVPADVAVGPVLVGGGQGVQAGQPPHQLAGLGRRQRAQVQAGQPPPGPAGQRERVPAGEHEPALPGPPRPPGQERGQLRVPHLPAAVVCFVQVVLEVVQQHGHRQPRAGSARPAAATGRPTPRRRPAATRAARARRSPPSAADAARCSRAPTSPSTSSTETCPALETTRPASLAEGPQHLARPGWTCPPRRCRAAPAPPSARPARGGPGASRPAARRSPRPPGPPRPRPAPGPAAGAPGRTARAG